MRIEQSQILRLELSLNPEDISSIDTPILVSFALLREFRGEGLDLYGNLYLL